MMGPDDEGLDPVGVDVTTADLYGYFEGLVQEREVAEVHVILAGDDVVD